MPRRKGQTKDNPSYRKASSGAPIVTIAGKTYYLGTRAEYGSPESWAKYHRLLAEAKMRGGTPLPTDPAKRYEGSVSELVAAYWKHIERRFLNPRTRSQYKRPLRVLRELYGGDDRNEFGPAKLRALREHVMVMPNAHRKKGGRERLTRGMVNHYAYIVRKCFTYGETVDMVKPGLSDLLKKVQGLAPNEYGVEDNEPREPVAMEDVKAVLPYFTPELRAIFTLLGLTGARPSEITRMRAKEINTSVQPWEYRPAFHKNSHRRDKNNVAQDRVIFLNEHAQAIISEFLTPDLDAYLFSPKRMFNRWYTERFADKEREAWAWLVERVGFARTFTVAEMFEMGERLRVMQIGKQSEKAKAERARNWLRHFRNKGAVVQAGRRVAPGIFPAQRRWDAYQLIPEGQWKAPPSPVRSFAANEVKNLSHSRHSDHYNTGSFSRAIGNAIDQANAAEAQRHKDASLPGEPRKIRRWTSYQIRHAYGTYVCDRYGIETAGRLLGHADFATTRRYTRKATKQAREAAIAVGSGLLESDNPHVAGRIGLAATA